VTRTKILAQDGTLRAVLERSVRLALRLNPSLGALVSEGGALGASLALATESSLPSETPQAERRFLYRFFATLWEGRGSVLEVGPFLGGTTRAIALGMMDNPRRPSGARLYTHDRFGEYYDSDSLTRLLEPLFARGLLDESLRGALARRSFKDVFDALHRRQRCSDLIVAGDQVVPDTPGGARAPDRLRAGKCVSTPCSLTGASRGTAPSGS
jgi:hypothetical protein